MQRVRNSPYPVNGRSATKPVILGVSRSANVSKLIEMNSKLEQTISSIRPLSTVESRIIGSPAYFEYCLNVLKECGNCLPVLNEVPAPLRLLYDMLLSGEHHIGTVTARSPAEGDMETDLLNSHAKHLHLLQSLLGADIHRVPIVNTADLMPYRATQEFGPPLDEFGVPFQVSMNYGPMRNMNSSNFFGGGVYGQQQQFGINMPPRYASYAMSMQASGANYLNSIYGVGGGPSGPGFNYAIPPFPGVYGPTQQQLAAGMLVSPAAAADPRGPYVDPYGPAQQQQAPPRAANGSPRMDNGLLYPPPIHQQQAGPAVVVGGVYIPGDTPVFAPAAPVTPLRRRPSAGGAGAAAGPRAPIQSVVESPRTADRRDQDEFIAEAEAHLLREGGDDGVREIVYDDDMAMDGGDEEPRREARDENLNPNIMGLHRGRHANRFRKRHDHPRSMSQSDPTFAPMLAKYSAQAPLSIRGQNIVWDTHGPGFINVYAKRRPDEVQKLININQYTCLQNAASVQFEYLDPEALHDPRILSQRLGINVHHPDDLNRARSQRAAVMRDENSERCRLSDLCGQGKAYVTNTLLPVMAARLESITSGRGNRRRIQQAVAAGATECPVNCFMCTHPIDSALWTTMTLCGHAVHTRCIIRAFRDTVAVNQHPDRPPTEVTADSLPRMPFTCCGVCRAPFMGVNVQGLLADDRRFKLPAVVDDDVDTDEEIAVIKKVQRDAHRGMTPTQVEVQHLAQTERSIQGMYWNHTTKSWTQEHGGCSCHPRAHPQAATGGVDTARLDATFGVGIYNGDRRRRGGRRQVREDPEADAGAISDEDVIELD